MSSIKLLSKDVVNKISAGEVVEKPASVVKELVENSIDAGANSITIEIKNGGITYISVADNGCGIKKDEVCLAFTPHATSKMAIIDDLNSLCTMGFRGEALATISAVSNVTLVTKTNDEDTGIKVVFEGSNLKSNEEIACVTGTKIEVSDLFFNTPARLKFLKKPKSEENEITNFVQKLILSHSNISFKYIVDEKLIYNTLCSSIIDNIYTIYGKEIANGVIEVKYEIGDYKVCGYISKPELCKANRTYQNLFVNQRFCNNALISSAVQNVYENFMLKGKFPLYVLFLNLPQNEVDVNVHPNKLEVKFADTRKVYQLFSDAIFKSLSDFNHIRNVDLEEKKDDVLPASVNVVESVKQNEGVSFHREDNLQYENYLKQFTELSKNNGSHNFSLTDNILPQVEIFEQKTVQKENEELNQNNNEPIINNQKIIQREFNNLFEENYRIVGKIFNTYLILELNDKVYFIDQHAAHERQNYDNIIDEINSNTLKKQDLMFPYTFTVSEGEYNFIYENMEILNSFGIDVSEFGNNTFKISAVPLILADIDLKNFVNSLLSNVNSFAKSPKEIIREKFMQMACKSAVKGGDDLKDFEIKSLLKVLKEKTEVLLCPHGRPIIIEIDQKQIEKWFKRIV